MKVGDVVPVTIAGQTVAQAKVVELDSATVTLIVPATQVVMAVRTELDTAPVEESSKQVIIDGVERRAENEEVVVPEQPVVQETPAPEVVETPVEQPEAAPEEEKSE